MLSESSNLEHLDWLMDRRRQAVCKGPRYLYTVRSLDKDIERYRRLVDPYDFNRLAAVHAYADAMSHVPEE